MEGGHCKVKAREIKKALEKEHQGRIKAYEDTLKEHEQQLIKLRIQIEEVEFLQEMFFDKTTMYSF